MKRMVWKFENYIFKWCYKLSRLSDPPLTPFKYWLPGQTISTLATRSSPAAVHSNEPKYNNPGQAAAALLRIWICKRCKCPVLMVTAETSISDKLATTAGIWSEPETQYSLPPTVTFIVTAGGGQVICECSWTQMSTFLLVLSNDGSVLFNFQSIWIMKEPDLQFLWCISFFLRGCRNSQKYFALWYAFLSPSLTYFHFMMLKQQKEKNGPRKRATTKRESCLCKVLPSRIPDTWFFTLTNNNNGLWVNKWSLWWQE